MSNSYNSNTSQVRRTSLNPSRRISSRGELPQLQQSRQSTTRLMARSFLTGDDQENMFETGHFSAKYISRNSVSNSVRKQHLNDFPKAQATEEGDLDNSNPVMITGGFTDFSTISNFEQDEDEAAVQNDSRSFTGGPSATPIAHTSRRHSVLSSMISSSLKTPAPKFPEYLKKVNSRNIGSSEETTSNIDYASLQRQPTTSEINVDNPDRHVVELVQKHLVSNEDHEPRAVGYESHDKAIRHSPAGADFDSLKLQGGDITRDLYNWVSEQKGSVGSSPIRRINSSGSISYQSRSRRTTDAFFTESRDDNGEILSVHEMMRPNGFRRSYIAKKHQDKQLDDIKNQLGEPDLDQSLVHNHGHFSRSQGQKETKLTRPNFFTNNFIEFLTLYGHFAGEDLTEDQDQEQSDTGEDEESSYLSDSGSEFEEENAVSTEVAEVPLPLSPNFGISQSPIGAVPLIGGSPSMNFFGKRRGRPSNVSMATSAATQSAPNLQYQLLSGSKRMLKKHRKSCKTRKNALAANKLEKTSKKVSTGKAFLLLLKAFIGTGIIFLPKAFSNGGLLFCNLMVVFFSIMSYYCFIILISTTSRAGVSGYGDAGFILFGSIAKFLVLISLALSQLGFASSYVIFVAENLKEILNTIFEDKEFGIELFIFLQLLLFVPLSLTRDIGKLSFTALIADLFIFLGLIYIYFESSAHLISNGISEKISMFKQDTWTLFIGTAVFSYEGIGLLIPIQESMANPQDFKKLLILVMGIVTCVFITLSTISYLSFGDDVKTVILMNFPKGPAALTIQLCYALAILLSTPLQLFPAIKIFENYLFHKDRTPWQIKIRRNSEARSLLSNNNDQWNPTNYESIVSNIPGSPLKPLLSDESQAMSEGLINQEGVMSGKQDSGIKWLKNVIRVSTVLLMCLIGYFGSSNLDNFVSLVGSFTCVPLIYIYPPLFYLKCFGDEMSMGARVVNFSILTVGLCLMAYTSFQTISNW